MEKLTRLLQQLKGIDDTYYFTTSGNYFFLMKEGIKFNLASDSKNKMAHFLKVFRKTGLKATVKNIENAHRVFSMIISIITYGGSSIDKIMSNQYLQGELYCEISEIAKRTIAEYLLKQVADIGYAGDDSEGLSYNYIKLKEVA
jgi:hypothetical protein